MMSITSQSSETVHWNHYKLRDYPHCLWREFQGIWGCHCTVMLNSDVNKLAAGCHFLGELSVCPAVLNSQAFPDLYNSLLSSMLYNAIAKDSLFVITIRFKLSKDESADGQEKFCCPALSLP